MAAVTLDDIQGSYEITYQSTPQMPDWYEPGFGAGTVAGNRLVGVDGVGVKWNATLEVREDGKIYYDALLDPRNAAPNAGLMNKLGQMTRDPQSYNGLLSVTKSSDNLILRTRVIQGPITIDVQFKKI